MNANKPMNICVLTLSVDYCTAPGEFYLFVTFGVPDDDRCSTEWRTFRHTIWCNDIHHDVPGLGHVRWSDLQINARYACIQQSHLFAP